jgi:RNA polymerase sigma-70 factor, ECF subfamily
MSSAASSSGSTGDPRDAELRELITRGDHERATEEALRSYGPELIGWLCSILPTTADAHDAFSRMSEELWKSLGRFDGRCAVRTWCYMLARHAAARIRGRSGKRREVLVSQIPSLQDAKRTRDVYAEIRTELDEEDQTLLVLRVDRNLAWRDIAQVLLGETARPSELTRKSSALRKQFERVKDRLRLLADKRLD